MALKTGLASILSLVILGAIIQIVGFQDTLRAVARAGIFAFGAVGVLSALQLILQAGAWSALNRGIRHRIRFRTLLSAVSAGMAVNIVTPSSYLGGEPVKVLYAGARTGLPYHELAGTVVLSKYLEALSFLMVFGTCTAIAAVTFREVLFQGANLSVGITLLVVATFLLVLCMVLGIGLWRRWRPLTSLVGLLRRIRPRSKRINRLWKRTLRMERQVSRVFREEHGSAGSALGLLFLSHVAIFLKPAVFFALASWSGLGLGELSLIFVTSQALMTVQITPSGVGTLDSGLLGTFALLGLGDALCMAFLLSLRFWDAVNVGVGALLGSRAGAGVLQHRKRR